MDIRKILPFTLCLTWPLTACAAVPDQHRFAGTWRLVSYREQLPDGEVRDVWGPHPRGRLMYDEGGRMAIQFMAPDIAPFASGDLLQGSPDEVKQAFEGYRAW